jgi:parallel beta-helix repeat protein
MVLVACAIGIAGIQGLANAQYPWPFEGVVYDGAVCDANTGTNYTSIQDAIDAANPGDTIYVSSGNYGSIWSIVIDKELNLIGVDNGDGMPVLCRLGFTGIDIEADNVTVQGFKVIHKWNTGIYISGNNCKVTGNCIENSNTGISVSGSYDIVSENMAYWNGYGIYVDGSYNVVSKNTGEHNHHGIYVAKNENTASDNNMGADEGTDLIPKFPV